MFRLSCSAARFLTADSYRQVAWYMDKILKGTKPAASPVEAPTKFEFVINLEDGKADRPSRFLRMCW